MYYDPERTIVASNHRTYNVCKIIACIGVHEIKSRRYPVKMFHKYLTDMCKVFNGYTLAMFMKDVVHCDLRRYIVMDPNDCLMINSLAPVKAIFSNRDEVRVLKLDDWSIIKHAIVEKNSNVITKKIYKSSKPNTIKAKLSLI